MASFQQLVLQNERPSTSAVEVLEAAKHGSLACFNGVRLGDTEEQVIEKLKPTSISELRYGTKYFKYNDIHGQEIAYIQMRDGKVHKMVGFYARPNYNSFPEDALEWYSSDRRVRVRNYPDGSYLLLYPDLVGYTPIHLDSK